MKNVSTGNVISCRHPMSNLLFESLRTLLNAHNHRKNKPVYVVVNLSVGVDLEVLHVSPQGLVRKPKYYFPSM
jgi:hypothetical protein